MAFIYRTVQLLLWLVPLEACYALARVLGRLLFHVKGLRKTVMKNLEIAFGAEKSPEEINKIARMTFINAAINIFEFVKLPSLSRKKILSMLEVRGFEHLDRYKGKGAILNSAHIGNFELLGVVFIMRGYPFTAVVRMLSNKGMNRIAVASMDRFGVGYISRDPGVKRACMAHLESGGFLGLTADQNAGERGVFVDFLGTEASTFRGPAELAMTLGVPLVPVFCYRRPDMKLQGVVEPPLELVDTGDFEADLLENTRRHVAVLERFVRERPADYFWFHNRWKTRPPGESA